MKAFIVRHNTLASIMVFDENGVIVFGSVRRLVEWSVISAVLDAFNVQEIY